MTSRWKRLISPWLKTVELAIFPSFCRLCGSLMEKAGEIVVCRSCWEGIVPLRAPYCPSCGRFFSGAGGPHYCSGCLAKRPDFSKHRSCGKYEGRLKDILLLYKYRGMKVLGKELAGFIHRSLGEEDDLWWGVQAIIPVPLHPKRQRHRGFNQALVMARELGRLQGGEVVSGSLVRTINTSPQTSRKAEDRETNVRGAFAVTRAKRIRGKTVLLVDDVFTTGATVQECSRVLKKAGAAEVRAITVAQA